MLLIKRRRRWRGSVHTVQLHFLRNWRLCFCLYWSCQICREEKLENQEYCVYWARIRILITPLRLHVIYENRKITLFFHFLAIKFTDLLLTWLKIQGYFNGFVHIIQVLMFGMHLFTRAMNLGKNHPCLHSSQGWQLSLGPHPRSYTCEHILGINRNTSPEYPVLPVLHESRPVLKPL